MSTTTTTTTAQGTTSTTTTEEVLYCTDADLVKVRPKILSLGVTDWSVQRREASDIITRALETRWYRQACQEYGKDYRQYPFDPDLMLNVVSQCTRLGVYKTLHLAYLYLSKDSPNDAFEKQAEKFQQLYTTELSDVLAQGIDYDWNSSGALDYTEKRMPQMRRLKRC